MKRLMKFTLYENTAEIKIRGRVFGCDKSTLMEMASFLGTSPQVAAYMWALEEHVSMLHSEINQLKKTKL